MKKVNNLIIFILFITQQSFSQITITSTTEAIPWRMGESTFTSNTIHQKVTIFPKNKKQQIDGFGGCFNERGMDALTILPQNLQNEVMRQLFDSITGCGFNICRMPIGASDYAMDYYSLDDTPNDFRMKDFSIERDKKYLIPYIKKAMQYNPNLKIWGSPWTPPTWMKESQHYACQGTQENSHIIWTSKILKAYALYFEKYIKAYRKEGINIYAIHVQNEPYACQNFPSCLWTGAEMRDFIRDYLGSQLSDLDVEIWLGTINNGNYSDCAEVVLSDPEAEKYLTGVGYQWDGKKAIAETAKKHPEMKLMQTESECGSNENNMRSAIHTYNLIEHYLKAGANSYMYWNMILDKSGLSSWGWPQNSMISIDRGNRTIRYNMEFYVMKHFAHFIKKGAHLLTTSGDDKNVLTFLNPDNKIIVVIMNNTPNSKKYELSIDNKITTVDVPEQSFSTVEI